MFELGNTAAFDILEFPEMDETTEDEAKASFAAWIWGEVLDLVAVLFEDIDLELSWNCWFCWAAANWATILELPSCIEFDTKIKRTFEYILENDERNVKRKMI